jgi:hypothetical protein
MGSWSPATRRIVSSMKRVAPMPAVPSMTIAPASPAEAAWRRDASLVKASSRPTNLALVYLAGMAAF